MNRSGRQPDFFERQQLLSDAATLVYMSGKKKEADFQRFMIQTKGLSAITGGDGSELDVRRFIGGSHFDEGVKSYTDKFRQLLNDAKAAGGGNRVDVNQLMSILREFTSCDALISAVIKSVVDSNYDIDGTVGRVSHMIRNSVSFSGELQRMISRYKRKNY